MIGMGAMLGMLGGNDETVKAVQQALGRTLADLAIRDIDDGVLWLKFTDRAELSIRDAGRSCCESRYLTCDDVFADFIGDTLTGIEVADGSPAPDDEAWDVHEVQFLKLRTNRGVLTVATHNVHNGYYGGFWLQAEFLAPKPAQPTEPVA